MTTPESLERVTRFDGGNLSKHAAGGNAAVATAPGVVCDESGWLAQSGDRCMVCGRPTRRTGDVIDELAQAVIDTGGTVEHVAADTPLKEDLEAAHLRFPLPFPSSYG